MARKKTLKGVIGLYFEQGMEVSEMVFVEDNKKDWWSFNALEEGDYLTVYNHDKSVAFSGKIDPVKKTRVFRSLSAGGVAVGWFQRGWKPIDWVRLFSHIKSLRATLRKKG